MTNIVTFCRRFGVLIRLQTSLSHSVRLLCQNISCGKDVPSSDVSATEAEDRDNTRLENALTDNSIASSSESEDDPAKIIRILNQVSKANTLALKHVSPNVTSRILSYREAHGPFASPTDLLRVPGIGQHTMQRICKGILQPPPLQVEIGKNNGSPIGVEQVGLTRNWIESLKDIVAVDIGLRHLGWVYMTRDRQVWQWRVKDIVGITAGKLDPPAYHSVIMNLVSEMPKPDIYVMEHQPFTNVNKANFQMLLFQRTLQSMLYATLNSDRQDTGTLRAISMPQAQVGRHFDLQVKGTRMSGQDVVAKLLREGTATSGNDEDLPARLTWENLETFQAASKHQKEHLSNCLLQAIAFYDLIVDQNG